MSRNLLSSSMLILCTMLISLSRPDVLLSILFTFKLFKRGLQACLPASLLILTECFLLFLVKGCSFPSGPFSCIDVRSSFAACVVFLSFLSLPHSKLGLEQCKVRKLLKTLMHAQSDMQQKS